jgi:predicted nucleic acid-binding protein
MVLADTSIWIEYLRHGATGKGARIDALLEGGELLLCGPVAAEIFAGVPQASRATLWETFLALPWAELGREEWRSVGETATELRRRGQSPPLTDIAIGVAAARAGAQLWTADGDFERIAEVLGELEIVGLE